MNLPGGCEGTWDAKPACYGWLKERGWMFHGCQLDEAHRGLCECRCGHHGYGRVGFSHGSRTRRRYNT